MNNQIKMTLSFSVTNKLKKKVVDFFFLVLALFINPKIVELP